MNEEKTEHTEETIQAEAKPADIINKAAAETKEKLETMMDKFAIPMSLMITTGLLLFSINAFMTGVPILGWAFALFAIVNFISLVFKIVIKMKMRDKKKDEPRGSINNLAGS